MPLLLVFCPYLGGGRESNGWERNIRMNAVIVCVAELYWWPPLGEAGRSTTLTGPTENTT